jgi:acetolactate synthase I/II/III large subunit
MWMARLYPTYQPNSSLISNGLATMAFAVPGAVGATLACLDRKVLAVTGDGGFLMSSQELETAMRERVPFVVLIWLDNAYGLIKWKMDMELGHHAAVDFSNPDLVKYAESFGAKGYWIEAATDLLPTLKKALAKEVWLISSLSAQDTELLRAKKAATVQEAVDAALRRHGPGASWVYMPEGSLSLPVRRQ